MPIDQNNTPGKVPGKSKLLQIVLIVGPVLIGVELIVLVYLALTLPGDNPAAALVLMFAMAHGPIIAVIAYQHLGRIFELLKPPHLRRPTDIN